MKNIVERKSDARGSGDAKVDFDAQLALFQQRYDAAMKILSAVKYDPHNDVREKYFNDCQQKMAQLNFDIQAFSNNYKLSEKQATALNPLACRVQFDAKRVDNFIEIRRLLVGTTTEPSPITVRDRNNRSHPLPNLGAAVARYNEFPEIRAGEKAVKDMSTTIIDGAKIGAKHTMDTVRDSLKAQCHELHDEKASLEKAFKKMEIQINALVKRRGETDNIHPLKVLKRENAESEYEKSASELGKAFIALDERRKKYDVACTSVGRKVQEYYAAGAAMGITETIKSKDADWSRLLGDKLYDRAVALSFSGAPKQRQDKAYTTVGKLFSALDDPRVVAVTAAYERRSHPSVLARPVAPAAEGVALPAPPTVAKGSVVKRDASYPGPNTEDFATSLADFERRQAEQMKLFSQANKAELTEAVRSDRLASCQRNMAQLETAMGAFRRGYKLSEKQEGAMRELQTHVGFAARRMEQVCQLREMNPAMTRQSSPVVVKDANGIVTPLPDLRGAVSLVHGSRELHRDSNPLTEQCSSLMKAAVRDTKATLNTVREGLKVECRALRSEKVTLEMDYQQLEKRLEALNARRGNVANLSGSEQATEQSAITQEVAALQSEFATLDKRHQAYDARRKSVEGAVTQFYDAAATLGINEEAKRKDSDWGRYFNDKLKDLSGELRLSPSAKLQSDGVHVKFALLEQALSREAVQASALPARMSPVYEVSPPKPEQVYQAIPAQPVYGPVNQGSPAYIRGAVPTAAVPAQPPRPANNYGQVPQPFAGGYNPTPANPGVGQPLPPRNDHYNRLRPDVAAPAAGQPAGGAPGVVPSNHPGLQVNQHYGQLSAALPPGNAPAADYDQLQLRDATLQRPAVSAAPGQPAVVLPPPVVLSAAQIAAAAANVATASALPPAGGLQLPPVPSAAQRPATLPMAEVPLPPPFVLPEQPVAVQQGQARPAAPPPPRGGDQPLPPAGQGQAPRAAALAAQQQPSGPAQVSPPNARLNYGVLPSEGGDAPRAEGGHRRPTSADMAQRSFGTGGGHSPTADELGGALRRSKAKQEAQNTLGNQADDEQLPGHSSPQRNPRGGSF